MISCGAQTAGIRTRPTVAFQGSCCITLPDTTRDAGTEGGEGRVRAGIQKRVPVRLYSVLISCMETI
jgi:hypothetical protein